VPLPCRRRYSGSYGFAETLRPRVQTTRFRVAETRRNGASERRSRTRETNGADDGMKPWRERRDRDWAAKETAGRTAAFRGARVWYDAKGVGGGVARRFAPAQTALLDARRPARPRQLHVASRRADDGFFFPDSDVRHRNVRASMRGTFQISLISRTISELLRKKNLKEAFLCC